MTVDNVYIFRWLFRGCSWNGDFLWHFCFSHESDVSELNNIQEMISAAVRALVDLQNV